MEFVKGLVVRSKAGKDKGMFFAVVGTEEKFVWVANGHLRRIEKPKRKSMIHLAKTNTVFNLDTVNSNKQLNQMLRAFGQTAAGEDKGGQELV